MLRNYRSYLEYKDMRRRIEAGLHRPRAVLTHVIVYLTVNSVMWLATYPKFYEPGTSENIFFPGLITAAWGFVLMAHAIWSYFHSGFWPGARETAIETEMSAHLQTDHPITDEDDLFQVHRMLDEDIRQRAGYHFSLSMFTFINAFIWTMWVLMGSHYYNYLVWYALALVVMVFVIGGGALNFWRSGRREQQRIQPHKTKRQPHESGYFTSAVHDRLELIEDDSLVFEKRKR
jgi:hypothetical protein